MGDTTRRGRLTVAARFAISGLGPAIALAAGAVYALSAPAWIVGGDNGEFVTLFARGGVAHPPGYPLYVMLLRAFAWVPGNPARVSAIVTAVIGAAAAFALHQACRSWGASRGAAAIATAVFASSSLAWRLGSSAEVFGLNVLLACSIAVVAAPGAAVRGLRRAMGLGLLAGLGLCDHQSIVLLAPLGLWALVRSAREEGSGAHCVAVAIGGLVVGLAPYAYLYEQARFANPASAWVWGNVHDARTLLDHFRRAEFGTTRLALRAAPLEPWLQIRRLATRLATDLLALPLVVLAAGVASLRKPRAHVVALAASLLLCGPAFVAVFDIAPRGVGALVVERFYLLPSALCALLGALALDRLIPGLRRRTSLAAAVAAMALVAGFSLGWSRVAEDHRPTVQMYVENTLRVAPPRAIVLGSGDQKFSGFLYASRVMGLRPDVDFVTPEMLFGPWYRARVSRRLGVALGPPAPDRVRLVSLLLGTGRPVAFAGPVPRGLLAAGFATYPHGTLQVVEPPGTPVPSPEALERTNVALLGRFTLEPTASASKDSWAGATFAEYARTWVLLEATFRARGETVRSEACRRRALAFAPWLR